LRIDHTSCKPRATNRGTGPVQLTVIDSASIASGVHNEDRLGHATNAAWVIDGATDAHDSPLTAAPTDAAWFAETLHCCLTRDASRLPHELAALPARLAAETAALFAAEASREPRGRYEHPSASGLIVRCAAGGVDFVSVGDCTLLIGNRTACRRFGVADRDAGDQPLRDAIAAFQKSVPAATAAASRAHVAPRIRATRQLMNTAAGYGVFSITTPPPEFVVTGHAACEADDLLLLASDGLMRLVDVYRSMTAPELLAAVAARGMAAVVAELRAIEAADPDGHRHPRAKISDDASGLLIRAT
jgi:hypothetical protein